MRRVSETTDSRRRFLVALIAIVVPACAPATSPQTADRAAIDRLLGLIGQRLDAASTVARTKWNSGAPIEDLPREQQIIDQVAGGAGAYGLDRDIVATFFKGQIEASKLVQRALHAEWTARRQPAFATVADLDTDIRPLLDRLTPALMRALAEALPILQRTGGRRLLETRTTAIRLAAAGGPAAVRAAVAQLLPLAR